MEIVQLFHWYSQRDCYGSRRAFPCEKVQDYKFFQSLSRKFSDSNGKNFSHPLFQLHSRCQEEQLGKDLFEIEIHQFFRTLTKIFPILNGL